MVRILILRHAPAVPAGILAGRRDVEADCTDVAGMAGFLGRFGPAPQVVSSPARRCLQTARALGMTPDRTHPALWEQDFGAWEGLRHDLLPDLGPMSVEALARHCPPGGESFDDMSLRVRPVLAGLDRDTLVIAHAGTVRAGLSLVVGPAALSFQVAPLSLTVMHRVAGTWSVEAVNVPA